MSRRQRGGVQAGARQLSPPPVGPQNLIDDLLIQPAPDPDQTDLAWTEFNIGDFDFNGEVNLADLTPLAIHFGSTYNRLEFDARLQTVYWLDGNGDGKIDILAVQAERAVNFEIIQR